MSRISDLIREAKRLNPTLGEALESEVRHLQERRSFGLNFERHTPESVELVGRPVRVGDKVRMLPPRGSTAATDRRLWIVTGGRLVDGRRVADLKDPAGDDTAMAPVDDLVVVAEHADTIYPGLVSTGRIERAGDAGFHAVINAENLHALKALLYTHRGKVDCIYIDPPYNTGTDDWIYSDRHVAPDDLYRHSKWLAFMERRLVLAKELLADTGVIIVAIGDAEHHRLRMLMDQVFDESNFLANITWQGGISALAKHTGGGADYMLVFAGNISTYTDRVGQWRKKKEGADEVLLIGRQFWQDSGHDSRAATELLRAWWRQNRKRFDSGVSAYDRIDESGRIFFAGDLANGMFRPNLQYDVLHPRTHKPVKRPYNGWRHEPEKMANNIAAGLVVFGPDENTIPTLKRYLEDYVTQVPTPTFYKDRRASTLHVQRALCGKRFPNPKDHTVLAEWMNMLAPDGQVYLDFFGGSGSTLEAVARLNAEDGGTRQCILVTNNEVGSTEEQSLTASGRRKGDPEWEAKGVHEYVTRPRITAVVTGERPDGSRFDDTVDANVEFLTLTYEAPLAVAANHAFARIAPLLWLRAGARGRRIDAVEAGWDVADAYGVLVRFDKLEEFLDALADQPGARVAFLVTDDDRRFEATCAALPDGVEPVRLYESYLRNFQIDAARSSR